MKTHLLFGIFMLLAAFGYSQNYEPPINSIQIEIQNNGTKDQLLAYTSKWLTSKGFEIDTVYQSLPSLSTKYRKFKSHVSIFDFNFYDNKIILRGWYLPARKESRLLKSNYIKYFSPIKNNFGGATAFKYMTDLAKELGTKITFSK